MKKMKKFIGFLALMLLCISFSAMGLDPPRDHTPTGHSIVICDDVEQATITTLEDQVKCFNAERSWQPPGILYELGIEIESVYPYPPAGEMQQNSELILNIRDPLSDLQNLNLYNSAYRKTKYLLLSDSWIWKYNLFRCDRAMYV